jgi:hypothetical protein
MRSAVAQRLLRAGCHVARFQQKAILTTSRIFDFAPSGGLGPESRYCIHRIIFAAFWKNGLKKLDYAVFITKNSLKFCKQNSSFEVQLVEQDPSAMAMAGKGQTMCQKQS